ncbi:hypothetical protein O988_04431 [Pseudogymnoascus sp. VKM F-3808]|nr:hypothetical protein O988_04431 [Pseudogymnoascus sp. VKM F-3808]
MPGIPHITLVLCAFSCTIFVPTPSLYIYNKPRQSNLFCASTSITLYYLLLFFSAQAQTQVTKTLPVLCFVTDSLSLPTLSSCPLGPRQAYGSEPKIVRGFYLWNSGLVVRTEWTQQWAYGGNTVELELPTLILLPTNLQYLDTDSCASDDYNSYCTEQC